VSGSPFRGVFAIPPTPFAADGRIDEPSLRRLIDFCLGAGAHGVVATVNASEAIALTDAERLRVAELVVDQVTGRVPVIVGVSGIGTESSVLYARHAAAAGAAAVMAMPPYVKHPPADEIMEFYAAVARAAAPLPVWIQHYVAPIGTPMAASLLARILSEVEGVAYLKEESAFAPQVMTHVQRLAGPRLAGVMGGMAGRFLPEEHRRGACGTMPACEVVDVHVQIWQALERGDVETGRELHARLLPLLNYEAMYSYTVYKEILVRRGVIDSARTRVPGSGVLDPENHRELDLLLQELAPIFTAPLPARD